MNTTQENIRVTFNMVTYMRPFFSVCVGRMYVTTFNIGWVPVSDCSCPRLYMFLFSVIAYKYVSKTNY